VPWTDAVPASDRFPLPSMSPERQKRRTLETLLSLILAMAGERPVLLIVEDLHWVDPTTLELLTLLLDQASTVRIFALLTARPAFQPPWAPRAHLTALTVNRLTRRQTEAMAGRVAGGKTLPPEILLQIVTKTDGVPLFVEELAKMVLESGLLKEADARFELTGPLPPLAIPSTLQDSLMARLDRLATVKEVAQLGATLGRAFPYELLRAVAALDEPTLQEQLGRLVEAELLYQRGVPPQATYVFKHALIQEAAYQSLLKSTRQQYHQRVAQAMVGQFPEEAEVRPEFVAHHYTEAGLAQQAVGFWERAGRRAAKRLAYAEAVAHFTKGLEVLSALPDTPARDEQELGLQIALGYALMPTKGWAAPDVLQAFTRARTLCERSRENPGLFRALLGLWVFAFFRADLNAARELAEQCVALGERAESPDLLVEAHWALGFTLHKLGDFRSARIHLEKSVSLYDPVAHRSHVFVYSWDPKIIALDWLAQTLWKLGYPDQALTRIREALAWAKELAHPDCQVAASDAAAWVHGFRREASAAREYAEAVTALAADQEFAVWAVIGSVQRSLALARLGAARDDELLRLKESIAALRLMGVEEPAAAFLPTLAEGYRLVGHVEAGLATCAEARRLMAQHDLRDSEAYLHWIRGDLLLMQPHPAEAEAGGAAEI